MRLPGVFVCAVAAMMAVGNPLEARASGEGWALNGTYTATSNGEWAKNNERFSDEASLRSTWTVNTECSYPTECTGTVTSDFGWSAPIYKTGGVWYVKRTVENWEPCPDGTAAAGLQVFRFVPTTPDGAKIDPTSSTLVGEDQRRRPAAPAGSASPCSSTCPSSS